MHYVAVVDSQQKPLMPTTPARARRWIRTGKATPFFKKGVFCVRLNKPPSGTQTQPMVVAIDPGSKQEGFTVQSPSHTYLNIQAKAVDGVKDAVETRGRMRRGRRYRNTPCRANRRNRGMGSIPPSTRARWGWKLRIAITLAKVLRRHAQRRLLPRLFSSPSAIWFVLRWRRKRRSHQLARHLYGQEVNAIG
jgi:hypothetical protein